MAKLAECVGENAGKTKPGWSLLHQFCPSPLPRPRSAPPSTWIEGDGQSQPVECFCYPKPALGDSANAIVRGFAPSFSTQVRWGEPGAPVFPLWPCYDTES